MRRGIDVDVFPTKILDPVMSQDTFSAFKRRETLGIIDQNNHGNSQIPVPASVLKRSTVNPLRASGMGFGSGIPAPRASFAPGRSTNAFNRSSSGGNVLGNDFAASQKDPFSKSRQSLAPSLGRRSSAHSGRQSSIGGFLNIPSSQVPTKDPRPIRDKATQAQYNKTVLEYLLQAGYQNPIGTKTLQQPTAKDFAMIFKFLYCQLDPNFKFEKKIEDDVTYCLKSLRYPFTSDISKSSLQAVGSSHSWPPILAMLHWIVELCTCTGKLMSGEIPLEDGGNSMDKSYFNLLAKAYDEFLSGNDDFSDFHKDLAAAFDERNTDVIADMERLETANKLLETELKNLTDKKPPLESLEAEQKILLSDADKFKKYMEQMEERRIKLETKVNPELQQHLQEMERELEELAVQRKYLQAQVDAQEISPGELDKMTSERQALHESLQKTASRLEELTKHVHQRDSECQKRIDQIERHLQNYNSLAYRIGIIPKTAPYAGGKDFELELDSRALSHDSVTRPDQIVNRDLRHEIRPALAKLRQELGSKVHEHQDRAIQLQEILDKLCEALIDKRDELENLQAKLAAAIEQCSEIKDNMIAENAASNAETERLDRDLQQMRTTAQNGMLQLEQRSQSVLIEYDALVHTCNAHEAELYMKVINVLEEVTKLKLHVQSGLQSLDQEAEKEYEIVSQMEAAGVNGH
ncbi:Kinetochore protein ndc80 [Neolecta irregularis DAH-3]|uniref:Kinetochore protein NDC80 n=1 Tax=Neolecta irregularis (strain DAH-3) TaxID=1198029 RepID=A0A1U7LTS9_NEOID|nr:Kinetochore protein ndc80 [Neolecta irregularis DAH-3]|eukprot:OLL25921.1 Kinetochore protein ndc80 [Neolecta irregularis DAH-3]